MVNSCRVTYRFTRSILGTHFVRQDQMSKKGSKITFDSRDHPKVSKTTQRRVVITTLRGSKIQGIDFS